MLFFCSSSCHSRGFRLTFEAEVPKQLSVCNALYKMSVARDGGVSCLHAGGYPRLKNTGAVTGLVWMFSSNPTSVSSFTGVGKLFQLAKAAGCASRHNPTEGGIWVRVSYRLLWKTVCNRVVGPGAENFLLRGTVMNPKQTCCCGSLAHERAWHSPVSFP